MGDPRVNQPFSFSIGLVDKANRPEFLVNPTILSGDFKVSVDGSGPTNLTNLPVVNPAGSRMVEISLVAAEMNGTIIVVEGISSGATFDDVLITILPTTNTVDSGVELAANSIQDSTYNRIRGTVQTDVGNSANQFKSNLSSAVDNFYNDSIIKFVSGSLSGQVKFITGYIGASKIITFLVGFTGIPSPGDTFDVINF